MVKEIPSKVTRNDNILAQNNIFFLTQGPKRLKQKILWNKNILQIYDGMSKQTKLQK